MLGSVVMMVLVTLNGSGITVIDNWNSVAHCERVLKIILAEPRSKDALSPNSFCFESNTDDK